MQTEHLCVLRMKCEVGTMKIFVTDRSKVVLLLLIIFVFVVLCCLFIAALWSPIGKELASWLSCM